MPEVCESQKLKPRGNREHRRRVLLVHASVFQLGIAIWANSVWLLATLGAAVVLIHYVVIQKEEQYLERKFGAQYLTK
jgi:protein-S-isoprenylcysteine O-methyltransferase Ste14